MLKHYCLWLETRVSGLTVGVNLFAGHIPQKRPDGTEPPALCTCILERTPAYVDPSNGRIREIHFQLYTRGPSYQEARDEAYRVFEACVNATGFELPAENSGEPDYYLMTTQGNAPASIDQDELNRFAFSANLTLHARKET
jgi:hypothetical protein